MLEYFGDREKMTDEIDIPTDLIELVTMLPDRRLRVDLIRERGIKEYHFSNPSYYYQPGEPIYAKLLEITGIRNPGDRHPFAFERYKNRSVPHEDESEE